ncbi:MAG: leucine-rich repeat protein [Clostridia bacterium]|nr:leucine-rich repeat protein [Clostridia bacterium]
MKKILAVLLSVFLLIGALPFAAGAAETVASGFCGADGENVSWTLNDEGLLVISGTGKMANYLWNGSPWFSNGAVRIVEVKSGVKSLGDYAFNGCTALTQVILPEVTAIGKYTFYGCTGLTELSVPDSVVTIGAGAFYDCGSLAKVNIPADVTVIGSYTFYGCASLEAIELPEDLKTVGGSAFEGCVSLTEIVIPRGVTTVGNAAFSDCTGLKEIVIPDSVQSVGRHAFAGCTGLCRASFGKGLSVVGDEMFTGCAALAEVTLPEDLALIGASAFEGCKELKEIDFPASLTVIGADAFKGCEGLTHITLPEGFASLGDEAFDGCAALTGVIVPAATAEIGTDAIPSQAAVYGAEDSYAQHWAKENGCAFVVLTSTKLTMTVPTVVSEPVVNVCGVTDPGANVTVQKNDETVTVVRAAANGKWSFALSLAGAADGDSFTVKASVTTKEKVITRTAKVVYKPGAASFEALTLEHNFHTFTLTKDELNAAKPNVTLAPGKPFHFKVFLANSESVRTLFVCSTKSGDVKTLPLRYDEVYDCWFADGLFDKEDPSYVPGALTVEGVDNEGNAINAGVTIKMNFLLTPAGYVYEAVRSNKLEGVTASVYSRDAFGNETLWNAEGAEQLNPLLTPPDGSYSWAVTKGTWQIRMEKDGYLPAASDWMTVPPAPDQLFLAMVTTKAPEVSVCEVCADGAEITFSQYMDIESVNEETVLFNGYVGEIVPLDAEETEEDSGVFYARTFRFTPAASMIGSVRITFAGVRNYAGIGMEEYTAEFAVTDRPERFTATDAVAVVCNDTAEITVRAENAAGRTVSVKADSGIVTLSDDVLTLDENGAATLTVTGLMAGDVQIAFSLDGTELTAVTTVTVALARPDVLPGDVDGDGAVRPEDARLALRMSVKLDPCEEGTAAFIAADANRDGAVTPEDARLILRAAVGLETLKGQEAPVPEEPQPATPTDATASPTDA